MRVPKSFNARNPQQRRDLASSLRHAIADVLPPHVEERRRRSGVAESGRRTTSSCVRLRERLRAHPCHGCPDREDHARWAERWVKLDRDTAGLRRRIEQRTNTIAREYDRVCEVLDELGYLDGDDVTPDGARLARIYAELDLVAAECLRAGGVGRADARRARRLRCPGWSTRPAPRKRPSTPGCREAGCGDAVGRTTSLWARLEQLERRPPAVDAAPTRLRLRLGRLAVGGGRDARRRAVRRPTWPPATSCAGSSSCSTSPTRSPTPPVTGPLRRTARETVDALRRGVVAYSLGGRLTPRVSGQDARSGCNAADHALGAAAEAPSLGELAEPFRVTVGPCPDLAVDIAQHQVTDHRDHPGSDGQVVARGGQPLRLLAAGPLAARRRPQHSGQVAVGVEQPRRRLVPDARHPRQAVGRVAAHHREVGVLLGLDAVLRRAPTRRRRGRAGRRRVRCRGCGRRRSSSTSWNRSRSPVTTSTGPSQTVARVPMTSSASCSAAPTIGTPSSVERLDDQRHLRRQRVGRLLGVGLGRPLLDHPVRLVRRQQVDPPGRAASRRPSSRPGGRGSRSVTSRAMKSSSPRTALTGVPSGALMLSGTPKKARKYSEAVSSSMSLRASATRAGYGSRQCSRAVSLTR